MFDEILLNTVGAGGHDSRGTSSDMLSTDHLLESLCGRTFGRQGLAVAIEELQRSLTPNRAELARRLCQRLNWHNAAGKPQLMSARVALLGFGAAARALADRDRLIGWDPRQKQARLCQVINNGRFLILPWVRSPNLASMVPGACVRHVRADFARCHGIRRLLLESFVERGRFRGSCYKAANWLHAGVIRRRGRNDRLRQADLPAKDSKHKQVCPLKKRKA